MVGCLMAEVMYRASSGWVMTCSWFGVSGGLAGLECVYWVVVVCDLLLLACCHGIFLLS